MKGGFYKREGKRGTIWYGRYSYTDPFLGTRAFRRVSAPTKKECESLLRAAIAAAESGK